MATKISNDIHLKHLLGDYCEIGECVTPGDVLANAGVIQAGDGTYVLEDKIRAALPGIVVLSNIKKKTSDDIDIMDIGDNDNDQIKNDVSHVVSVAMLSPGHMAVVPCIGDIVLAKVLRTTKLQCQLEIVSVGTYIFPHPFSAVLRKGDVRKTQIDTVDMFKCFVINDIIKAEVLSLGNRRSYYLTTAQNEYGVIIAHNHVSGERMVPISWNTMQCPVTKLKEERKVAKVVDMTEVGNLDKL